MLVFFFVIFCLDRCRKHTDQIKIHIERKKDLQNMCIVTLVGFT